MKRNVIICILSLLSLGLILLFIVDIGFPELIAHPYLCHVNVIESNKVVCGNNNPHGCIQLKILTNVTLVDGYVDIRINYINCDPPLSNCTDFYNNKIFPCTYYNYNYDISKYNNNNILCALLSSIFPMLMIIAIILLCVVSK